MQALLPAVPPKLGPIDTSMIIKPALGLLSDAVADATDKIMALLEPILEKFGTAAKDSVSSTVEKAITKAGPPLKDIVKKACDVGKTAFGKCVGVCENQRSFMFLCIKACNTAASAAASAASKACSTGAKKAIDAVNATCSAMASKLAAPISSGLEAPCKTLPAPLLPICANATQLVSSKLKTLGADACSIVAEKAKPLVKHCDISQANVTAGVKLPEAGAVDDGGVGAAAAAKTKQINAAMAVNKAKIMNNLAKPAMPPMPSFRL